VLEALLGVECRRGAAQSRRGTDAADLEGLPWWIECKRQKQPNIRAALRQAVADTDGRVPVAMTRADRDRWVVSMRVEDWPGWAWLEATARASSAPSMPAWRRIDLSVPCFTSGCIGTMTTFPPRRSLTWLPLPPVFSKPSLSSARTTRAPDTCGSAIGSDGDLEAPNLGRSG
jgi:hypothetical protein